MRGQGWARVVLAGAALTLVASCASRAQDEPDPEPSTEVATPPSEPVPNESPTVGVDETPPFPPATAVTFDRGSGEWDLVLHDVRVAGHDGYDRIVVEFTGTGVAGWSVQYVGRARLDGSGEAVRLGGEAFLDIYASHTTWPSPGYYDGPRRLVPEDSADVDEVYVGGTFEGYTQVIAGIDDGARPFRVFTLTEPSRLVVDVVAPDDA